MIFAQRTNAAFPLALAVSDDAGPVTGLSPTVRIRALGEYLDFDDATFKAAAWVTIDATLVETSAGQYLYELDLTLAAFAAVDALVAEFHVASPAVDASDVIVLQQLATIEPTLSVSDDAGGVTGLTATLRVRDEAGAYLDFDDSTFKGAGWIEQDAALTDLGRGHYSVALDTTALIGQTGSELVLEYLTAGDLEVAASEVIAPLYSVTANAVAPTVTDFDPALGADVDPGDAIAFSVLDDESTFSVLAVLAYFETASVYEVIHDGTSWGPMYSPQSSRAAVAGGWRYTLTRRTGWPREALVVRVLAADGAGNVITL